MKSREPVSRRAMLRTSLIVLGSSALSACTEALGSDVASFQSIKKAPARSSLEAEPIMVVATTRQPTNNAVKRPWFGPQRSNVTNFATVTLNPPDRSVTGQVAASVAGEWSIAKVQHVQIEDANEAMVSAARGRNVLIYVHGFNETFETAAIGAANISHGVRFTGVTALFDWPSKGELLDYGYDRESALLARDPFEALLAALAKDATVGRIHIVAHSMGTLLTLEALRQIRAQSGDALSGKFGAVVLASPDIDVDVFTNIVTKLGAFARKLTLITSTDDRALDLSRRMAGGVVRVGAAEAKQIEALGVRVVDASGLGWGIIKHDRFLTNADVRKAIRLAIDETV